MAPGFKIVGPIPGNKFDEMTGTSQATAFVTGVASLLISHYPHLKPYQIKDILIKSSRKKEPHLKNDKLMGGRLNALKAFRKASQLSMQKSQ